MLKSNIFVRRENFFPTLTMNAFAEIIFNVNTGVYFRLGEENTYKSYVNQYSTQHHALSRIQAKEEGEKRSRLSHKFSLTDVSFLLFSYAMLTR